MVSKAQKLVCSSRIILNCQSPDPKAVIRKLQCLCLCGAWVGLLPLSLFYHRWVAQNVLHSVQWSDHERTVLMNCKDTVFFNYEVIAFCPHVSYFHSWTHNTVGQNCCAFSWKAAFDIVLIEKCCTSENKVVGLLIKIKLSLCFILPRCNWIPFFQFNDAAEDSPDVLL